MDSAIRELERAAATGDPQAKERLIARKIRMGELPYGALVTLDASLVTEGWPTRNRGYGVRGPAPSKLTGRWLLSEGWREGSYSLRRVAKSGPHRVLKSSANNSEWLSGHRLRSILVSAEPWIDPAIKTKVERAPADAKVARRFSMIGPCLTAGLVVRETPKFYVLEVRNGYDREKGEWNVTNTRVRKSRVHVEPCRSCTDHPQTSYPYGYQD